MARKGKMKQYKFIMPIEVRTTNVLGKTPEYIVKGYASTPNIPDIYKVIRSKDGKKVEGFKSVFTKNCIESMNRQGKSKKIFIDAEHRTAIAMNVNHFLDNSNIDEATKKKIIEQIEIGDLPIAKPKELYIDDETGKFVADTRMNPHFKGQSEFHSKYFDAVWGSLQDGFLDGMSINMVATKFKEEEGLLKIDDVDLFGISYTGGGASPENNIFEVAVRAITEVRETQVEERKMQEELERRQKELDEREKAIKTKEDESRKAEEAVKKVEMQKELDEAKKLKEDLQKELEASRKARETGTRGLVPQEPEPPKDKEEWTMEHVKFQDQLHDTMVKRLKTSKNKEGDLTLGHLLALDHEGEYANKRMELIAKKLDTKAASMAFSGKADIHIPIK